MAVLILQMHVHPCDDFMVSVVRGDADPKLVLDLEDPDKGLVDALAGWFMVSENTEDHWVDDYWEKAVKVIELRDRARDKGGSIGAHHFISYGIH